MVVDGEAVVVAVAVGVEAGLDLDVKNAIFRSMKQKKIFFV